MDTTIDTLAIEIETEAGNSLKNIDTLINRLEKLSTTLSSLMTNYNKLDTIMKKTSNMKIKNTSPTKMNTSSTAQAKVFDTGSATDISKNNTSTADENVTDIDDKKIDDATEKTKKLKKEGKETKNIFQRLFELLTKVAKLLGKIGLISFKPLIYGVKNVVSRFKNLLPSTKATGEAMKKAFSNSLTSLVRKFALAMIGVRSLFTALRASVQEYLQYDTQLEDSLRNNWAVLGSLLAPALEKIIQLFGIAVAYIRAFVKALTGIDLVARANKKSIDSVGNSAKKALGNLAKFDELNVVEFPTKDGGGSSIPPLTTPEIDTSKIDWFVKYIKEGNWYGLGMEIGRLFNEGLRTINFDWFIDVATQWATNIADLFNGLTDGVDWALLGEKIAGGLNTAFAFVNTFYDRYNFENLGRAVSTGLNNAIQNTNWESVGQFFANKLVSIIDFAFRFVENFDFAQFGESIGIAITEWVSTIDWGALAVTLVDGIAGIATTIGKALSAIDWEEVGRAFYDFFDFLLYEATSIVQETDWSQLTQTIWDKVAMFLGAIDWSSLVAQLFEGIGSAFGASRKIIETLVKNVVNMIANYFSQYIEEGDDWQETGRNIILGVLEGLIDGIKNIGVWIYDNIFVPFIDGFKAVFDIHSPSKVMEELGRLILQGLLNGLKGIGKAVSNVFQDAKRAIKDKLDAIFNDIKETFSIANISRTFEDVKTTITNKFNDIKNNIKTKMSEAWSSITSKFSLKTVGDHFQKIYNKIKNIFKEIGTTVGNVIGKSFANVVNAILKFAEKTINGFIKSINKVTDVINAIPGVKINKLNTIEIPKLATGTNRIEAEGLYHLHKNEAVVPEKYNPAVNDNLYDNKGVIEAIDNVYDAINNLGITNVVNLGNKTLYKETIKYSKTQNNVYGENVMSV